MQGHFFLTLLRRTHQTSSSRGQDNPNQTSSSIGDDEEARESALTDNEDTSEETYILNFVIPAHPLRFAQFYSNFPA